MSIAVMTRVWSHSQQKGSALLLLLAVADAANDDGYAFPGIAHLARKTRMSERNVMRLIQKCEESGELRVQRQANKVNRYWVTVTEGDKLSRDKLSRDTAVTSEVTPVSPDPSYNRKNNTYTRAREVLPEPVAELVAVLGQNCKPLLTFMTEEEYNDAAYTLHAQGATPDDVRRFRAWWEKNGYYAGAPALKSLLGEWVNFQAGVQKKSESHRAASSSAYDLTGIQVFGYVEDTHE